MPPLRFICHSKTVLSIALKAGWLPGARYTNLRDVRHLRRVTFVDIVWQQYDYARHLSVVRDLRPCFTVAQDITRLNGMARILDQANELARWACKVIIVPKAASLADQLEETIPREFVLGYSVPTRYGGTRIDPRSFRRPVHLLGGRPDVQRALARTMRVVSVDGNRFTLDAAFGDYFDGERFRPHPTGGYRRCLAASIRNINRLWGDYEAPQLPCKCGFLEH